MEEKDIPKAQRTLAIDFDGVIHKYSRGWQDGSCYDEPVEGVKEALEKLHKAGFRLVCLTTRHPGLVWKWLTDYQYDVWFDEVTDKKVGAIAYIDDRAVRFTNWPDITKMFC